MSDKFMVRKLDAEVRFKYLEFVTVTGYERWSSIHDALLFANSESAETVAGELDAGVVVVRNLTTERKLEG